MKTSIDNKYCYPNSNVLINKLGYMDSAKLFEAEIKFTTARLNQLQVKPLKGNFDFEHLKTIHGYIFQDIYEWAGKERTVEIGKGNLFCTVACIQSYAKALFGKYFPQCYDAKDDKDAFVETLAGNYGDLNALHPFREGNGRAQREFARLVCLECGYGFDLYCTNHAEMLQASIHNFETGDTSKFVNIFSNAVYKIDKLLQHDRLHILTCDDFEVNYLREGYYGYVHHDFENEYSKTYMDKTNKMLSEFGNDNGGQCNIQQQSTGDNPPEENSATCMRKR